MIEIINFLKFYYRLLRQNLLDQIFKKKSEIPSALLRKRVHGSFCPESYLQVGENIFQDLLNLSKLNTKFDHKILDFGCGPGRIARNFFQQGVFVYGTDIDEQAINYCKKNFPNGDWCVNEWTPPFKYKSNFFDFIYSVSVFTHINQELQRKWLKEVSRILKPDGIAVVSIHGKNCFGKLNREEISLINDTGFYFKTGNRGILKTDGLPDEYQTSYQNVNYTKREWMKYFDFVDVCECGIGNHQDAVILKKPLH